VTGRPYRVGYTPAVRRALSQQPPPHVVHAVLALIDGDLASEPTRVGKRLRAPLEGTWSARRGTYRLLYEVDHADRTVTVVAVEHRADAYRQR
jgi:mRNA-degrading endonuclease RelE of RelBE toxin-antitoxin system